jgi:hypothetical protein
MQLFMDVLVHAIKSTFVHGAGEPRAVRARPYVTYPGEVMRVLLALPVILVLVIGSSASADHLPDSLLSDGRPEKVLAHFSLDSTKLASVIRTLGQPTRIEHENYFWVNDSWTLQLVVYFPNSANEYLSMIRVEGSNVPPLFRTTGRGLRLGDSITDLVRIYGKKYLEHKLPKRKLHEVMVQWRSPEISLVAQLDTRGRIWSLSLLNLE